MEFFIAIRKERTLASVKLDEIYDIVVDRGDYDRNTLIKVFEGMGDSFATASNDEILSIYEYEIVKMYARIKQYQHQQQARGANSNERQIPNTKQRSKLTNSRRCALQ